MILVSAGYGSAQSLADKDWHLTFQTGRLGPVETVLVFKETEGGLTAHSLSGARSVIAEFPRVKERKANIGEHLLAFSLKKTADGYAGELTAPWAGEKVSLILTESGFKGKISGGLLGGAFSGVPATPAADKPLRDYRAAVEAFLQTVETKVFDPRALRGADWKIFARNMKKIGAAGRDDLDLLFGFHFAYESKPFSHLTLARANVPAPQLMIQFDSYRVGGTPAVIEFDGDVAVLTVKTMIGVDTVEQIEAAFQEIGKRSPKALIIDLRGNGGGAFAIKPLIEHVIDRPLDAGYFITHRWNIKNDRLPSAEELSAVEPWQGFSLKAWWENIQSEGIIRLEFKPAQPNFDGPVFVLIDSRSASATEMAADALSTVNSVTLVGETTEGQVLSQSPFDTSDGFQAFIPVADYYSTANGRLEGVGVKPQVEAASKEALEVAKKLAQKAIEAGG
ncbi:MAG: S41 family peptidase [Pyrinomonadaceae bacterium]